MPSVSSTPGFLRDLFTPLPENQTSPEKDPLDHAADYADTSAGAWDVFRCVDHALSWLKMLPSLPDRHFEGIQKVKDVASAAGMGLSVPKMIADFNTFRRGLCSLFATQDLPYSDPLRTRKIAQAAKKSFIDAADLTNTVTQAALFADNAKLVLFEAGQLNAIDGVNNLTSVISDGSELITECVNLQNYHSAESQPRNQAEAAKLAERKTLSWMVIAKDVTSIGVAAIALVGIVFGVATQSIAALAIGALSLSTVWLVSKLASYFYKKIVVEAPPISASRELTAQI